MMTHIPISHPENLQPLIKTTIRLLTGEDQVDDEYTGLRFCLTPSESGNGGYLLLGLSPASGAHMRLRDLLLSQQDAAHDSTSGPTAWYPPPYHANPDQASPKGVENAQTPTEIATFLKTVYTPFNRPNKEPRNSAGSPRPSRTIQSKTLSLGTKLGRRRPLQPSRST